MHVYFFGIRYAKLFGLMFIFKVSQPNLRTAGPNHAINSAPLNTYIEKTIPHTIHVWYIYLHEWLPYIGKYTIVPWMRHGFRNVPAFCQVQLAELRQQLKQMAPVPVPPGSTSPSPPSPTSPGGLTSPQRVRHAPTPTTTPVSVN